MESSVSYFSPSVPFSFYFLIRSPSLFVFPPYSFSLLIRFPSLFVSPPYSFSFLFLISPPFYLSYSLMYILLSSSTALFLFYSTSYPVLFRTSFFTSSIHLALRAFHPSYNATHILSAFLLKFVFPIFVLVSPHFPLFR